MTTPDGRPPQDADELGPAAVLGPPSEEALDRGSLQERAVRGVTWTMIHTAIAIPVAFLVNLLIARVLGVADYGRLAFLTALMEFVSGLLASGFGAAVMQFGSKAHAAGRTQEVAALLSKWQGFRVLFALPILSVVVVFATDVSPAAIAVAVVFGVVLPSTLDGAAACLGIENKTAAGAKITLITSLATQAAVVVVLLLARTPEAVWFTRLIVSGLAIALCLVPISKAYRRAVLRPTLPRHLPTGFLRFAVLMGASGVVGGLVTSRSEIFVMNAVATPAAVGIFALAFGLSSHVFAPAQAFLGPLIPAISGLREVDSDAVSPAFRRVMRVGSTVVGLLCAGVIAPLAVLVPSLYGAQFAQAAPVVVALSISAGLVTCFNPVYAFVTSRLSGGAVLKANLVALALDLGLAFALIPSIGVWGAVIANAAGALTTLTILLRLELRQLGLGASDLLADTVPVLVGSAVAAVGFVATEGVQVPPVVRAVALALVGTGAYLGGVRLVRSGLSPTDAQVLSRGLPAPVRPVGSIMVRLITGRPAA
ncbi:oligosaccharide flippase family protein [Terrabacter sp. NPDC080008]|uniref:lipopolysaccharide biosynthesis protein n=1 Tax=Terrabacter sp. NPDC080008 TaxID=3155176 RepID=UPI00344E18AA